MRSLARNLLGLRSLPLAAAMHPSWQGQGVLKHQINRQSGAEHCLWDRKFDVPSVYNKQFLFWLCHTEADLYQYGSILSEETAHCFFSIEFLLDNM